MLSCIELLRQVKKRIVHYRNLHQIHQLISKKLPEEQSWKKLFRLPT